MNEAALQVIQEWLTEAASLEALDFGPIRDVLRCGDLDLPATTPNADGSFAACLSRELGWKAFVPVEASREALLVIGQEHVELTNWDAVRADPANWVTPRSRFAGIDDAEVIALPFDGTEWEGSSYDYGFEQGDWQVLVDGEPSYLNLNVVDMRYRDKIIGPEPGTHIRISEGGTSRTTGDIGEEVNVDRNGGVWIDNWGGKNTYCGRREQSDFSAFSYLPVVARVSSVSSDVFTFEQMRDLLTELAKTISGFDPDNVYVSCPYFEGWAADLLQQVTPTTTTPIDHYDDQ